MVAKKLVNGTCQKGVPWVDCIEAAGWEYDNASLRVRWKQAGKTCFFGFIYLMVRTHVHLIQTHTSALQFSYSSEGTITRLIILYVVAFKCNQGRHY